MGGAGDVGVGQDGKELRRRASEYSRRVDVPHRARKRGRHRFEGLISSADSVGFDQQHAEVPLVTVSPGQLVLENRAHEAIVEEPGGAVDDMQGLGLWVISLDSACRAEDRAGRKWRAASLACQSVRPAP
jgi:hypothetical protein